MSDKIYDITGGVEPLDENGKETLMRAFPYGFGEFPVGVGYHLIDGHTLYDREEAERITAVLGAATAIRGEITVVDTADRFADRVHIVLSAAGAELVRVGRR